LKFSSPEVEKRSLDIYDTFIEGGFERTISAMIDFTITCST